MPISHSVLIKNGTIVGADNQKKIDILIEDGMISALGSDLAEAKKTEVIDADNLLIFPGLIDCHVHFREPGLEHKETMATGAAAALAGGVTTVCEMPNTIPPTVTVAALADKVRRASAPTCDIRFFFGATEPIHLQTLRELWTGTSEELQRLKKNCCGLKLYLDDSTGDQKAPHGVIEEAFKLCAELKIVVVCHCEDHETNQMESGKRKVESDPAVHSLRRPPESEVKSIEYALSLAKKYGTHLHVAHLSTKDGLDLIRAAKKTGVNVTCEVAPHHLFLTVDDYKTLGTLAKMNPPLRTREHQEALWAGIADGTVDCVSTDHAPHTLDEKHSDDPMKAPSGVPGVETMLPLLLTAANDGKLRQSDIVRLCFENPNHIFNLGKQEIAQGAPADLILVDPKKEWVIKGKELHSKCGWSPFENWKMTGKVISHCPH